MLIFHDFSRRQVDHEDFEHDSPSPPVGRLGQESNSILVRKVELDGFVAQSGIRGQAARGCGQVAKEIDPVTGWF